ncbi:MAG TPA: type II toxin-antitoxin system VapC family toxin [Anaerolineae bacterium]
MIGLDTNLLVRLVVQDDKAQSARVRALLAAHGHERGRFYVNQIVLAESVWVLRSVYRYRKPELLRFLNDILGNAGLVIEADAEVEAALFLYQHGGADFADSLIAAKNLAAGCKATITFDETAARIPGYRRA